VVNWASGAQVSYSHFSHFLLQLLIGNWVFFSDFTISSSCAKPCVPLPLAWGCNTNLSMKINSAYQLSKINIFLQSSTSTPWPADPTSILIQICFLHCPTHPILLPKIANSTLQIFPVLIYYTPTQDWTSFPTLPILPPSSHTGDASSYSLSPSCSSSLPVLLFHQSSSESIQLPSSVKSDPLPNELRIPEAIDKHHIQILLLYLVT